MKVSVYNLEKEVVRDIEISDDVFGVPFNEALVHQAMLRQMANARQGTQSTKTRAEVSGSGRKLYRQKHTGNARAGDLRSPIRRKGGVALGPKPRDYRQAMPKKMRRQALRAMLSAKLGTGELMVLEKLELEEPKTKEMARILGNLGASSSALIAMAGPAENVIKAARNIPGVKTTPADLLNVLDLLSYSKLVITEQAVRKVEALWGKGSSEGESHASL